MKIGILGAGGIAGAMAYTVNHMDEAEGYAIGSRSIDKAKAFAEKYGFEKAYGSYDEVLDDPQVELVYVALPHSHHYEWTIKALNAGKHVLCEKAFAANAQQAREMIELSEKKGLLLTEAIWTRYMPARKILTDLVDSGTIGKPCTIAANLGARIDMNERLVNPALAGGALLDLTVYPLTFASMVWGDDIKRISASCVMTDTGVDGQDTVMLEYNDGRMASLFSTIYGPTTSTGVVTGTEGYIEAIGINNPGRIIVHVSGKSEPEIINVPPQISGYEYEVLSSIKAIEEGRTECPEMPHAETIEIMEQMDEIRRQFGIVFPFE